MIRAILSAVLGYAIMVAVVLGGIAATWFGLGSRFAFQGDTNQASLGWSLIQLAVGFVGAWIAGCVVTRVAGTSARLAIGILLCMLIGLGILNGILLSSTPPMPMPEGKTIDSLSFAEAGSYARSPGWYNIAIVVLGCLGLLIGFAQHLPRVLGAANETKSAA